MAQVTVTICTTCRRSGTTPPDAQPADQPRPGARLHARLSQAELPDGVRIRAVECLSACSRGCSLILSGGEARWSYIYGDLDPEIHVDDIVAGVHAYAATSDGLVPWRERPTVFRKQSIARIPPQSDTEE